MSKYLYLLLEGKTEKLIFERFLKPYFENKKIDSKFTNLGGNITTDKIINSVNKNNDPNCIITTFIDYYGYKRKDGEENLTRVELENNLKEKINKDNFIPYIQEHEAETLLFCDSEITAKYLKGDAKEIEKILKEFDNQPEKINNDIKTAPSKRIKNIFKSYQKCTPDFCDIICEIGIEKIKSLCHHFKWWLNEIERQFN